jgi:hypothetical protein
VYVTSPDKINTMIVVNGVWWGTADEIASALGTDIKAATVRRWAERSGLEAVTVPGPGRGTVRYPLDQAATIEAAKRRSLRGRPRRLDFHPALV